MTNLTTPTPAAELREMIAEARERHREVKDDFWDETVCRYCRDEWRCDTSKFIAALDVALDALDWYANAGNFFDFCPGTWHHTDDDLGEFVEDDGDRARAAITAAAAAARGTEPSDA